MEEEQGCYHKTRDFICSCGKNYLSYAALFTHIKQKHDGKAPGPIVRPRSQRKRGRPRKNPLADHQLPNSDSNTGKNGISIVNEINNINNINLFQSKQKQAAELLGCGEFKGFKTYRPDFQSFSKSKNTKQPLKKLGFKRYISNTEKSQPKMFKEETWSENEIPDKLNHTKSTPISHDQDCSQNSYPFNFVIAQMKNMFQGYKPSQQEKSCNQIVEILDRIGEEINLSQEMSIEQSQRNLDTMPVENGLKTFVSLFKNYLEVFQLKQVSFFLSLFYEHIQKQLGISSNEQNLGLKLSQLTKYITTFLFNFLPSKIEQLQVGCLQIFKNNNPTNLLITICNWISIHSTQTNSNIINSLNIQSSQKLKDFQGFRQVRYPEPQKDRKKSVANSQPQLDIKFQEINYVFDQLRHNIENNKEESTEKTLKQQKNVQQISQNVKKPQASQKQSNSQEFLQNLASSYQQIQRLQSALGSKNSANEGKMIMEQR